MLSLLLKNTRRAIFPIRGVNNGPGVMCRPLITLPPLFQIYVKYVFLKKDNKSMLHVIIKPSQTWLFRYIAPKHKGLKGE